MPAQNTTVQRDVQGFEYRHYHDSPAKKPPAPGKLHHTDRYRLFKVRRGWCTPAKAGLIGYFTGRGYTSSQIANVLHDGTRRETIRGWWRRWGLPLPEVRRGYKIVPVALSSQTRNLMVKRAAKLGLSLDEYLRRIITCAVSDDLYRAIVDDRYDEKPAPAAKS